jgi:RND family efflux transporter MFP subunit
MKRIVLPLLVLAGGVAVLAGAIATRPKPARTEARPESTTASYVTVSARTEEVRLPANGTVTAAESVVLQTEVSGRVLWKSPNLVPGGRFRKGEVLLRIDPREYGLALEQQKANVDRARLEIDLEKSRQSVAEREWELLGQAGAAPAARPADPENALALRGPQLRTAKTALASAEGGLERARLALDRTTIRAPFEGLAQTVQVDVGQVVMPQQPLGTLVGTDQYWVQVSVPVDWLVWLTERDGSVKRTPARVRAEAGPVPIERAGRVVRLLGDVDPVGRMARVLVEIDDPLGLRAARLVSAKTRAAKRAPAPSATDKNPHTLPLLIGTYVNVEISAGDLADVIEVPNRAMREGNRVYVVGPDSRLHIREVGVVFRTPEFTYVRSGLQPGDKVITSRIAAPAPGMLLRPTPAPGPEAALSSPVPAAKEGTR